MRTGVKELRPVRLPLTLEETLVTAQKALRRAGRRSGGRKKEPDVDPFDPFPEPVRLEIGDVFDLHSVPPREVRAVVEEYLHEAH